MKNEELLIILLTLLLVSNAIIVACLFRLWRKQVRDQINGPSLEIVRRTFTSIADSWDKTSKEWKHLGESGTKFSENYQKLNAFHKTQMIELQEQINRTLDRVYLSEMKGLDHQTQYLSNSMERLEDVMIKSRDRDTERVLEFLSQHTKIQQEGASQLHAQVQELNKSVQLMVESLGQLPRLSASEFSLPERTEQIMPAKDLEVPTSRIDKVHFTLASPPAVQPGKEIIVDVWAHLEQQRAEVANRVQQASIPTEAPPIIRPKGPFKIERGTILFVRLKFQDLKVEPAEDVILWEGEIGNASFVVSVPVETLEGVRIGSVTVHCEEGLQIARIPLQLMIKNEVVHCEPIEQPLHRVRKAFVSYARTDLDEVLSRIQGMQKIIPDLDVFLDVVNLRSGEDWEKRLWNVIPESDVFYLFWSAAAKESTWVEKEWRCALSSRGVDFIDPVPLVSPKDVPPPEELSKMHFNDWSLAYRRGKPEISI